MAQYRITVTAEDIAKAKPTCRSNHISLALKRAGFIKPDVCCYFAIFNGGGIVDIPKAVKDSLFTFDMFRRKELLAPFSFVIDVPKWRHVRADNGGHE